MRLCRINFRNIRLPHWVSGSIIKDESCRVCREKVEQLTDWCESNNQTIFAQMTKNIWHHSCRFFTLHHLAWGTGASQPQVPDCVTISFPRQSSCWTPCLPSSSQYSPDLVIITWHVTAYFFLPLADYRQPVQPAVGAQISPWPEQRSLRRAC